MKCITKYLIAFLSTILVLICVFFLWKIKGSEPLTVQKASNIMSKCHTQFVNVVEYMSNHPEQVIHLDSPSMWPPEISQDLSAITHVGNKLQTIYVGASDNKTIHFKFSMVYPGKDTDGVDIQLVQEIVHSDSFVSELYIKNGLNTNIEHITKIEDKWYLGCIYY